MLDRSTRNEVVNTLFETPDHQTETFDHRCEQEGMVRKANNRVPNQGRSRLRWLKAAVRNIDSRRDALERMHWQKVWRSMVED
jgi:hypothetical protein